jgi:hypothetical protein
VANLEALEAQRLEVRRLQPLHDRARRAIPSDPQEEVLERFWRAFDLDDHSRRRVEHPTGKAELGREPVRERPEPDALNGASDLDAQALHRRLGNGHGVDDSDSTTGPNCMTMPDLERQVSCWNSVIEVEGRYVIIRPCSAWST